MAKIAQLARGWHRGWGREPQETTWALESTRFTAELHCLSSETKGPVHVMTAGIWKYLDTNPGLSKSKGRTAQGIFSRQLSNWNPGYRPARIPPCGRWSQPQDEGIETFCCIKGCFSPSQSSAPASPNHSSGSRTNAQGLPHEMSHLQMGLKRDNRKRHFRSSELDSWLQHASGPICCMACPRFPLSFFPADTRPSAGSALAWGAGRLQP